MGETTPGFWRCAGRGLLLRCPRCGVGRLYSGFFTMTPACSTCALDFYPEHGYYVGAMYLNYAMTVGIMLPVGLLLQGRLPAWQIVGPILVLGLLFPVLFFRWSRSLWLSIETCIRSATSD